MVVRAYAAALAACSGPAFAGDPPKATLSIDPISARGLLAPVEAQHLPDYRLDSNIGPATGSRAKLSVEVGDATLFAITGRLTRRPVASGPLEPGDAQVLRLHRDSGKVYGGGVSRTVRGVELNTTYQYSKVSAGQPGRDSEAADDGPGKSHSLRASARIRFGS